MTRNFVAPSRKCFSGSMSVAFAAFALASFLPHGGFAAIKEDFSGFRDGRSVYVKDGDWKKFGSGKNAQPGGNTVLARSEGDRKFISMVARGHDTVNARSYRQVDLPVSAKENNVVLADIRYATPEVQNDLLTTTNISLNASKGGNFDPQGSLNMGIMQTKEGPAFFFNFGNKQGRIATDPQQIKIDPQAWYRFGVEINPETGRVRYIVQDVTGAEPVTVWSGDNTGMADYRPETFSQINLMVARPGRSGESVRSADFANISVGP